MDDSRLKKLEEYFEGEAAAIARIRELRRYGVFKPAVFGVLDSIFNTKREVHAPTQSGYNRNSQYE